MELAYLTATHKPPQRAKRSIAKSNNTCNKRKPLDNHRKQDTKATTSAKKKNDNNNESSTETKDDVLEDRTTTDNASEDRKTKDNVSDDRKSSIVSPRVKVNSQIKGRVNSDEVSRLAKNAEALLVSVLCLDCVESMLILLFP